MKNQNKKKRKRKRILLNDEIKVNKKIIKKN